MMNEKKIKRLEQTVKYQQRALQEIKLQNEILMQNLQNENKDLQNRLKCLQGENTYLQTALMEAQEELSDIKVDNRWLNYKVETDTADGTDKEPEEFDIDAFLANL